MQDPGQAGPEPRRASEAPGSEPVANTILALQRSIGNAAVARLLMRQPRRRPRATPPPSPAPPSASPWHPPPATFRDPVDNPQPISGTGWRGRPLYGYGLTTSPTPEEQRESAFNANQLQQSWYPGQRPPTQAELQTIRNAVTAACRGNPELLARYYEYYGRHRIRVSTASLGTLGGSAHGAETHGAGETVLAPNWSTGLSPGGLGAMLMHEFVHGGGPTDSDLSTFDAFEGYAYAIDLFLAERAGATERVQTVLTVFGGSDGRGGMNRHSAFLANFVKAYGTVVLLYDVIDHGHSAVPDDGGGPESGRHVLHGLSPERARSLAAQFIAAPTNLQDPSLRAIVELATTDRLLVRTVFPATALYREREAPQPHR